MRKRLIWFLLGVLTAGVVAYAAPRINYQPPLSDKQIKILEGEGYRPIKIVKEIVEVKGDPYPAPYPVEKIFRVEVPPAWVEPTIIYRDQPATECPDPVPTEIEIGGTCEIDVVKTMARAFWSCNVETDQGWSASRGPFLADEQQVIFEATKGSQEPRWRRDAWFGPWKGTDGWGAQVGLSGQGRKWSLMAGVGLYPHESGDFSVISDDEGTDIIATSSSSLEPGGWVMAGRRW